MRGFNLGFVRIGALFATILASTLSAHAAGFSNANLKGSYSFVNNLWTTNAGTNAFAMLGVMTFDGAGNVTASYTSMSGGDKNTGILGGTYAVNSKGAGTIKFTSGSSAQFAIALNSTTAGLSHGIQMLQSNDSNNEIVSGAAELQAATAQTYNLASLKGNFTFQGERWTADSSVAQNGFVGIFNFNGKGTVKGSLMFVYQGGYSTNSIKGTYTVNADGSGGITLSSGVVFAIALNTVAKGHAGEFQMLETVPGTSGNFAITGTALTQ